MQLTFRAPKQVINENSRYIAVRIFFRFSGLHLYRGVFVAKNPCRGTGMQFALL
jgi:hypothetical protein